jgi:purine-binding chemotaxis protein CheW
MPAFVTFVLRGETFAIPVKVVQEILDYNPPSRIPNCPPYMQGLSDVRGQAVPVIDLGLRLGLPKVDPIPLTKIVVLDLVLGERSVKMGLVADKVCDVATFTQDQIGPAPEIGVRWSSSYIDGVVQREGDFVIITNLGVLLTNEDDPLATVPERAVA